MAAMFRGRSTRSRRLRGRQDKGEDFVSLDYSKDPGEILKEVLTNIVRGDGISKEKKLAYFNAFARFCYRKGSNFDNIYSKEEILCCLRTGFSYESKEIKAACLRALRYFIQDKDCIEVLVRLQIDYLIARSLDICLDNDIERIHAMKLIRKILHICPDSFPPSLLNVMVSIANDGAHERDKMVRVCLATLCELAFSNTKLLSQFGGINSILKNILVCRSMARINESLVITILYLLNQPSTRHYIREDIDLEQILAPFTDCHFKNCTESPEQSHGEEKENRFVASKMAITTIVKSWPGMIRLCKPDASGLQSIIGILYLKDLGIIREIMEVFFDIFRFPLPEWTEDFSLALLSIDPSEMREAWRLVEGFVAEEGKFILPHLATTRPNLVDNHTALSLSAHIRAGLLEALVHVITTCERAHSVQATILLGEILHMASMILPQECGHYSHCLPTLMTLAASFDLSKEKRQLASCAVNCLNRLHAMKKRGPVPCSLYLDQIIQHACIHQEENTYRPLKMNAEKLLQCIDKENEKEIILQSVKDSQVISTRENKQWDWDLIVTVLKWPDEELKRLDDENYKRFVRRLLYFFKPSNRLFGSIELTKNESRRYSMAALQFVDFLLECDEFEGQKCIEEWLEDIKACLSQIKTSSTPHTALFAPSNIVNTLTQDYFLILGRFSYSTKGGKYLENLGIYQYLLDLMTQTSHDTYIKLIVSSLNYAKDGMTRIILSKALTSTSDNARLYTVRFMRVLLRAKVPFWSNWGMEMLVLQLYDQNQAVAMEALSVISEACEEEVNLHTLVNMHPSVLHLGNKGAMLLARFLSIPAGFKFLSDANYVDHELDRWYRSFNVQYVHIVEERLNEALTTYEKTYDGSYIRRSSKRQQRKDVFVPIHLYGQLVQHKNGYTLLQKQAYIKDFFDCIRFQETKNEKQIINLKSALWAVGHIGTSVWGMAFLQEEIIIPNIIKLAEESGVFSIRGTAYYVLGLIASTTKGADMLSQFGWEAVRHKRTEMWPVLDPKKSKDETTDLDYLTSSLSTTSLTGSNKSEPQASTVTPMGSNEQLHHSKSHLVDSNDTDTASPKSASFFFDEKSHIVSQVPSKGLEKIILEEDIPFITEEEPDDRNTKESGDLLGNLVSVTFRENRSESAPLMQKTLEVVHPRSQSDPQNTTNTPDPGHSPSHRKTTRRMHISNSLNKDKTKGYHQREDHHREERSSSNESSRTSKSRSDSVNTDTTTSGIGSFESGPHITPDVGQLTPIPSAGSVATNGSKQLLFEMDHTPSHPSETLRRLTNLKRIPSTQRRYSNPVLGQLSPSKLTGKELWSESCIGYTTIQDAQGYATLRELQRDRTRSMEVDPDLFLGGFYDDPFLSKTRSLDFRPGKPRTKNGFSPTKRPLFRSLSLHETRKKRKSFQTKLMCGACGSMRNPSISSLHDITNQPQGTDSLTKTPSRDNIYRSRKASMSLALSDTGRAEYIGLCLPIDINMIFQVNEGEDKRSLNEETLTQEMLGENLIRPTPARTISEIAENKGLEYHTPDNCLGCYRLRKDQSNEVLEKTNTQSDNEDFFVPKSGDSQGEGHTSSLISGEKKSKSRTSSLSELIGPGTGSMTSNTSVESTTKPCTMSEDSEIGVTLIRKEVLRLLVNLSSSVGVKGNEQGLLTLKQKFPKAFQDICLYSEVCFVLANYNFRLNSRRFIQELFQDVKFDKMLEESFDILDLAEEHFEDAQDHSEFDVRLEKVLESIS